MCCLNTASADQSTLYVNNATGNDSWNGQSAVYNTTTGYGPKQSISSATGTVTTGGTIHIANGTYTGPNNNGITIDRNMTLIGESQTGTIIDAQGAGWIIAITNGATVFIENLTLTNGNTGDGGAISNYGGALTVTDSTFTHNTANSGGGAIYNSGGALTVTDSTFTHNTANSGGAISNWSGTLTVTGSTFTQNTADNGVGGAIYNYGNLNVTNSTFNQNTADSGGVIYNEGTATVNFNRIVDNTAASHYGNAIYLSSGSVDAENNWWGSNTNPKNIQNLLYGDIDAYMWIILSINASPNYIKNDQTSTVTADFLHNMDINGNSGPLNDYIPDGIPITFTSTLGTINNADTINGIATATFTAGDIPGTATISAATDQVPANTITTQIRIGREQVYVSNTNGDDNNNGSQTNPYQTIKTAVAGVYTNGTIHIANGTYTGPNNNGITIDRNMTLIGENQNNTIIDAEQSNYILHINRGITVFIENLTLQNGNGGDGGAIFNSGTLTVTNSTFNQNTGYSGGAINNYGTLTVTNSTFNQNTALNEGGAIYNLSGTVTVTNSTFNQNTAYEDGGAIYNEGTATVNFNRIVGNTANTGSAICDDSLNNNSVNAENNWWGSNANPSPNVSGVSITHWIILKMSANPTKINKNETSQITANFNWSTDGNNDYQLDPNDGHIPDGTPVTFSTTLGSIPASIFYTENGKATTTFTAGNIAGTAQISGLVDSYTDPATSPQTPVTVQPSAILNFTKTVSKGTHYYGDTIHYYLTIKNNGTDDASNVSVFDKLPAGLTFKSATANIGTYTNNTWTVGTLKAGQTATLDIKALIKQIGTITNTAKLTYSTYPATPINQSVSFTVPQTVTIPQLITASAQIKSYAESHNYKLPTSLTVAGQKLTMPQLLQLLTTATINISKNNLNPINVTKVGNAPYPNGYTPNGNLYSYITVASNIHKFIKDNGRAPNYAQTALGNIQFTRLVYMYAKTIKFYGNNHRLPNYVYTAKL